MISSPQVLSLTCAWFVDRMLELCHRVGAPSKVIGPTTCIDFLGVILDTLLMEACLPPDKLEQINQILADFHHKKKCTKREMLSLIGRLAFASKVVPAGRFFLRRLIDTAHTVSNLSHHIYLNQEARADLAWWEDFLPTWIPWQIHVSGITLVLQVALGSEHTMTGDDMAGRAPALLYIVWKELFPIFLACSIWGHLWKQKRISFHCDNQAVVEIWRKGSTKDQAVMALVRKTFLAAAKSCILWLPSCKRVLCSHEILL